MLPDHARYRSFCSPVAWGVVAATGAADQWFSRISMGALIWATPYGIVFFSHQLAAF